MDLNHHPPDPAPRLRSSDSAPAPAVVKVHIDTLSLESAAPHDPTALRQSLTRALQESLARELPTLLNQPGSSTHHTLSGGTIEPPSGPNQDNLSTQIAAAIRRALNQNHE